MTAGRCNIVTRSGCRRNVSQNSEIGFLSETGSSTVAILFTVVLVQE